MGDATRFAFGILILIGAMIFFFFAFHPNGVDLTEQNPVGILKWLMDEFNSAGSSVTKPESTGTTQAPDTTTAAGRG